MQLHMPKTIETSLPPRLALSPFSLTCPYCKAKRGQECKDDFAGLPSTHVERIRMAGLADRMGNLRTRAEKRARRANGNPAQSLPLRAPRRSRPPSPTSLPTASRGRIAVDPKLSG